MKTIIKLALEQLHIVSKHLEEWDHRLSCHKWFYGYRPDDQSFQSNPKSFNREIVNDGRPTYRSWKEAVSIMAESWICKD